jgi:subtilase family serine protease
MSRSFSLRAAAAAVLAAPLALTAGMSGAGVAAVAAAGASPAPFGHLVSHHRFIAPPTTAQCEADFGIACYSAGQFQTAYNLKPLYDAGWTGKGSTIAIVDAFGSPTAKADLRAYSKAFGLPDPPSFRIIQPAGKVPPFDPNNADMANWAGETSLDLDMAHAIAPDANILLVETPVAETEGTHGFPQIVKAENFVIQHHLADVITQSFGATEQTFPSKASILNLRSAVIAAQKAHITVLASSGDDGATDGRNPDGSTAYLHRVTSWPAADPLVTGLGGTQLFLDAAGNNVRPPATWNDTALLGGLAASGGGRSVIFSRPSYQDGVAARTGSARGVPDISMSAAVDGGAIVFAGNNTLGTGNGAGFYVFGGTSEASPQFSGIVAIADQAAGHDLGLLNPAIYRLNSAHAPGLVDITDGTNTVTFDQGGSTHTVIGFDARKGYDLATGVGGIDGAKFVPELIAASH